MGFQKVLNFKTKLEITWFKLLKEVSVIRMFLNLRIIKTIKYVI